MVSRKTSPSNKGPRVRKAGKGFGDAFMAKRANKERSENEARSEFGAAAEKLDIGSESSYSWGLKKDALSEGYEKLGDENRKLVDAFVSGLLRVESDLESSSGVTRRGGPETAPILYANRENKNERVVPFIIRVYGGGDPKGGWLNGDMTRADLRHIDEKCANALRDHESRHGKVDLDDLNLPTVKQRNDRLLASDPNDLDESERRRLEQLLITRELRS